MKTDRIRTAPLTALVAVACLLAASLSFAADAGAVEAEPAKSDKESLPEGVKIVSLQVKPESIRLENRFDYVQMIVTGLTGEGEAFDVTRLAKVQAPPKLAEVTPRGIVNPLADGAGELVCSLGEVQVAVPVRVAGVDQPYEVDFIRDVAPVLSKLGCNAGTCHGAKDGKNGFKLSLRGYDPVFDVRALVDDLGARRINRASPQDSLMLLKATGSVPHVGGQLTQPGEKYYRIIHDWIAQGHELDRSTPKVERIRLAPVNPVVQRIGMRQQVRVLVEYADGTERDVTAEAFVETGNKDIATVDGGGLITVLRRGEAPILARFEGAYAATTVTVMGDRDGFQWTDPPANNDIDELVYEKLKRTKILPSPVCTDAEFARRLYLDLTGLPPTAGQVREFLADSRGSRVKRDELIDRLVGSPEYVEHWTNKWADMLQVNRKYLGREGSVVFRNWIKQAIASNMPYDEFAYRILTASGSNRENPAASYWKILRDPQETMENTTHLFLAVRFNCNKCHDHPFERWTQDQYYHLAAYFAQVGLKKDPASGNESIGRTAVEAAKPLYEVVYDRGSGEVKHDQTGEVAAPEFPYPADYKTPETASRREELARWITSPDNQYFASSYANRIWGYLTGVGLIEPIDDIRAGNPPTNPKLLERLTQELIESGFDTQQLVRTICKSRTYQRSVATNRWNEDDDINYSHATARRLPAEVLYDAVHRVTGAVSNLPGLPAGMRAAELPDAGVKLPSGFLDQFGRPARESSCECERTSELMLGPVMALVNGPTIAQAIADPNNAIARLVQQESDDKKVVGELFLRILNRKPTEDEISAGLVAMRGVEEDHQALLARLAEYEKKFAGQIEAWKKQQQARIEQAEQALAVYRKQLPERFAEWEQKQKSSGGWTVLKPIELASTNGAKLKLEDSVDLLAKGEQNSIFVSGKNGKGTYTFVAKTDQQGITGIRLELLPDERLPAKGPGRAQNGNFVLNEFTLKAAPAADASQARDVRLQNAQADFSQQNYDVSRAVDGNAGTGWASSPQLGQKRTAVFETSADVGFESGTRLTFDFDHQYDEQHTIGRFRLSVTTDARPLMLQGHPEEIKQLLAAPADKRSGAQQAKLLDYFRKRDGRLKQLAATVEALKAEEPPLDPQLARLRRDVEKSKGQLADKRLIGAQDLAWALINSPAFLFNR